ncbi:MAG: RNase adapter RapZ [Tyzzerella sp.]|nr:RNase adapter RapZ [Tyzzerella sp.]
MRMIVVTGMSGAGKSTALKMLEDIGYFCVDNLPVPLVPKLADMMCSQHMELEKVALGIDIRSGQKFQELESALEELKKSGIIYEILFLDAQDDVLVKRYKETRRTHPLAERNRIDQGILKERKSLESLRKKADYIIDTSQLLTRELQAELNKIFVKNKEYKNIYVTILSFGFKYGIPNDADLVFDVRFLPNPYYIEELRAKTGNDKEIRDFVMENEKAEEFLMKLEDLVRFLIPNYVAEGKHQLVIAIGCTGGKHRSVTLANELFAKLQSDEGFGIKIEHRDIEKDAKRKK